MNMNIMKEYEYDVDMNMLNTQILIILIKWMFENNFLRGTIPFLEV